MNLEGVKRIMALEAELAAARERLAQVADEAREGVEAAHRQYRRDLVPVSNSMAVFMRANRRDPS